MWSILRRHLRFLWVEPKPQMLGLLISVWVEFTAKCKSTNKGRSLLQTIFPNLELSNCSKVRSKSVQAVTRFTFKSVAQCFQSRQETIWPFSKDSANVSKRRSKKKLKIICFSKKLLLSSQPSSAHSFTKRKIDCLHPSLFSAITQKKKSRKTNLASISAKSRTTKFHFQFW